MSWIARGWPALLVAGVAAAFAYLIGQLEEATRQAARAEIRLTDANAETKKANAAIEQSNALRIEEAHRFADQLLAERARLEAFQAAQVQLAKESAKTREALNDLRKRDADLDRLLDSLLSDEFLRLECDAARRAGARALGECVDLLPGAEPAAAGALRP